MAFGAIFDQMKAFASKAVASSQNNIRISDKLSTEKQRMALNAMQAMRPTIIREFLQRSVATLRTSIPGSLYEAAALA